EWPTVKSALLHRSEIIRHEVAAQFVALIDDRPKLARFRLPSHAVRVTQAGGKNTQLPALQIKLQNIGAHFLRFETVLGRVAVGADSHIKLRAVLAGNDVFGPMVVDRSAWQVDNFAAVFGDLGHALAIFETHN